MRFGLVWAARKCAILSRERYNCKQKPRTGRMDLRIAAIALAHGATLVTRNLSDFDGIEGLPVLDWSRQ